MNCKEIWLEYIGGGHGLSDEVKEVFEKHKGHELELVKYGNKYYAIECVTCHEVLLDDEALPIDEYTKEEV